MIYGEIIKEFLMDQSAIENLQSRCRSLKVLFVEDDEVAQKYTRSIFSDFFDHIDVADNGFDAYALFEHAASTQAYDLVITDIKMPRLDGIQLIIKLRKIDPDIAVIVTSAHSDSDSLIETLRLGVNGYILKPIELDQLLESLVSTVDTIYLKKEAKAYTSSLQKTIEVQKNALEESLYQDALTKLPNQRKLDAALKKINAVEVPTLFLITILHFNDYTKLYGLEKGNEIVKAFAASLKKVADALHYETFAVTFNEFVMLKLDTQLDPDSIYEDITHTLEVLDGLEIQMEGLHEKILIHIAMGVTFDQENLFKKAFTALDFAKQSGKPFVVYTSNLDETESLANDFYWQDIINDTLNQDNVIPFFQPICNPQKRIVKYEALIRIRTKDKAGNEQFVSPYYFLDIARRTKQYDMLSLRMIEKVLDIATLHPHFQFSINFSFRDMLNKEIRDTIRAKMIDMQENHQPFNVVFEVLESEKVTDFEIIKNFLKYIKCDDVPIAIDDFGTGYSNFSNIMEMKPAYVKIDASLIKNVDHDQKSFQLVKAIISFAKALGIKTIAEYVYTESIFETLLPLGIDEFQGYYIGEPQQVLV